MKQLKSRLDIEELVHAFYKKVRKDQMLGSIFNNHISEDNWPAHLSKLTDFWESNLLGVSSFHGSPTRKHVALDNSLNNSIDQLHFAQWLRLWVATVDELFEGELAERAKYKARKMATGQYIAIWQHRSDGGSRKSLI